MLQSIIASLVLAFIVPLKPTICIDPGHPSENGVGTHGKKLTEVRVCWEVAKSLKTELEKDGYRVVLTKGSEKQKVTNRRRAEIANKAKADLFIRLHCDAGAGGGFETLFPSAKGTSQGVIGPSDQVIKASSRMSGPFHRSVIKNLTGFKDRGVHPERRSKIGAKQGALTGSIFSKVPVLLVEMCVLTNSGDEQRMMAPGANRKMALALKAGIRSVVPMNLDQ